MDKIDEIAKKQRKIRVKTPLVCSSVVAAAICIVFMWNPIYSRYMNNKEVYNPPLIKNTQAPQKMGTSEFIAMPGKLDKRGELPSEEPSATPNAEVKNNEASKKPKSNSPAKPQVRSNGASTAAKSPVVASVDENSPSTRAVKDGTSTTPAPEKSTFVATTKADEVIAWINENLAVMSTKNSKGYTIINLSEKDFYLLKVTVPLFGGTTTDISENAPYADIVDASGGYSAVIYNP